VERDQSAFAWSEVTQRTIAGRETRVLQCGREERDRVGRTRQNELGEGVAMLTAVVL
jgi:hypothetical protein